MKYPFLLSIYCVLSLRKFAASSIVAKCMLISCSELETFSFNVVISMTEDSTLYSSAMSSYMALAFILTANAASSLIRSPNSSVSLVQQLIFCSPVVSSSLKKIIGVPFALVFLWITSVTIPDTVYSPSKIFMKQKLAHVLKTEEKEWKKRRKSLVYM